MKKLHPRVLTRSRLFFLVAVVLFLLSSLPTAKTLYRVKALQRTIAQETQQAQQLDLLTEQVGRLRHHWQRQQLSTGEIEAKIPPDENLPELIAELDLLADSCGIRITGLTVGSGLQLSQGGQQTKLELTVQGPYNQVKTYLNLLLGTDRYLVMKTAELSRAQGTQPGGQDDTDHYFWLAHISLNAFFWPSIDDTIGEDDKL